MTDNPGDPRHHNPSGTPPQGRTPQRPQWGQPAQGGQQPQWGQPQAGSQPSPWGQQPQWGQPAQWGQQPQWGQPAQGGQQPPGSAPPPPGQGWQQVPPGRFPGHFQGYTAPPKPGIIPLRPLGLGEMLDGAFQACRRNPAATFGTAVVFQLIVVILTLLLTGSTFAALMQLDPTLESEAVTEQAATLGLSLFSSVLLLALLSAAAVLVLQGVLVIAVARAILNRRTGFAQMWRLARGRLWPLVGMGLLILAAMVVALAVVAAIIAGLVTLLAEASIPLLLVTVFVFLAAMTWLSVKLVLAPAALVMEGAGVFASIRRSWILTHRNWWRTFGILVLMSLIVGIISSVVSAPLSFIMGQFAVFNTETDPAALMEQSFPLLIANSLINSVFGAIGFAFQSGVIALLYVDLRIRREGFDVVLMKEHEAAAGSDGGGIPGQGAPSIDSGTPGTGPGRPGQKPGGHYPPQQFGHNPHAGDGTDR